jgi:tetratricopeptide (TPR) repeat protein
MPASEKIIKDPAEYNAYVSALNITDPAAKATAMEAFVQQYPQSVLLTDALEQAIVAYQQAGNADKVRETAKRILLLIPNHVRAMAILTVIDRAAATLGGPKSADFLRETCDYSQTGLQQLPSLQKPAGTTDDDFKKLHDQVADVFNGAAGFCALQAKNYAQAQDYLTKAIQIDPTNLQDVYQLSIADLEMNPTDINGLWYCAKSINLAQGHAQSAQAIATYCKAKYKRYHGGDDGWDAIVTGSANEAALPPEFATRIKPAPTPCELAVLAVQQNDPSTLSFSDQEFILSKANCSPANKAAADKVWQVLQDEQKGGHARLKLPAKVISASASTLDVAVTDENQQANKADVHVRLERPMMKPLAPGTITQVIGVLTRYTPDPFMFTMEKGALPAAAAPPAQRPPVGQGIR